MTTRTKFICQSVTKTKGYGGVEFHYAASLLAVMNGSEENKKFFTATPSGSITISTIREDHFEVGKSYYVDFSPAED